MTRDVCVCGAKSAENGLAGVMHTTDCPVWLAELSGAAQATREANGHGFGDPVDPNDVVALTQERRSTHGEWSEQAMLSNDLKAEMHRRPNWDAITPGQREALDMIAVKIGRILCGDADHADHWDDIAGYAHLGKGGHTR